jgi:molecular chaperone DnaK (HSP70)
MPLTPSIETYGIPSVYYRHQGQELIGRTADDEALKKPKRAIRSVKQRMAEKEFTLEDGSTITPVEVVEKIMEYIIHTAEEQLEVNYKIEDDDFELVIAFPVIFGDNERNMIKNAAYNVTLKNGEKPKSIGMIPEPVAAAMAYFESAEDAGTILVYDLGGGTIDVALVQSNKNSEFLYEVIDQRGGHVGGDDWDKQFSDWLQDQLETQYNREIPPKILHKLPDGARKAKERLSKEESFLFTLDDPTFDWDLEITRNQFDELTHNLLQETLDMVNELRNKHSDMPIDHVILVGGGSHMPQVQDAITGLFPGMDIRKHRPESAIAYGAAIFAHVKVGAQKTIQFIATHNYGIEYLIKGKAKLIIMIRKGAKLPASGTKLSYTNGKTRTSSFAVYESALDTDAYSIDLHDGKQIMFVEFDYGQEVPKGKETNDTLTLTEDNLLQIVVIDPVTNKQEKGELRIERQF